MTRKQRSNSTRSIRKPSPKTFWHPPAVALIEVALPPEWKLETDFSLRKLPQRIDLLVIRREVPSGEVYGFLPALIGQLQDITIVEFKGGTDAVSEEDVAVVLGYACQYEQHWRAEARRLEKRGGHEGLNIDMAAERPTLPTQSIGYIAPRLTPSFRIGLEHWGGSLEQVRPGLWKGTLANRPLFFIETEVVWRHSHEDRFFYVLTKDFLQHGLPTEGMTEAEFAVYNTVERWFVQVLEEKAMMIHPEKLKKLKEENERFIEELLAKLPPERLASRLRPEERLSGLGLADRLAGLTPAQLETLKKML